MRAEAADTARPAMPRLVERRQPGDARTIDADAGIAVDGGEGIDLQRHRRIAAHEGAVRGRDDDLALVVGADQRGGVDQHDAAVPAAAPRARAGSRRRARGRGCWGGRRAGAARRRGRACRGATPRAAASALAWLTVPRAIMSAASPMRQLACEAVAAATPSACAMAMTAMPASSLPTPASLWMTARGCALSVR